MARSMRLPALIAAAATAGFTLAACGSSPSPSAAGAVASTASPSPTAPATAPGADACNAFAQVYNSQVGPLIKAGAAGGDVNVYFTKLGDEFTTLAGTLSGASDPYSQTIVKDAQAIAADPSSLTDLDTFSTDLQAFLTSCGMSPGS